MKKLGNAHELQIEDVLLTIRHDGEFAFEIPTSMTTAKYLRFKEKYAQEINAFKSIAVDPEECNDSTLTDEHYLRNV